MTVSQPLLRVEDLHVRAGSHADSVDLVRGVDLEVPRGTTLAVVGESGSGKSLTALSMMGLLPFGLSVGSGSITFDGTDLTGLSERQWQPIRGQQISMIFQDPLSALNPVVRVGDQIAEMFRRREGASKSVARAKSVEAMAEVGIPDPDRRFDAFPHEFSGGMRQRAMIAIAMALRPQLLIADEPTTALDVTVQAQILRLLDERKRAAGLTLVLISHDLGVVSRSADYIAVMYAGTIVEFGAAREVLSTPAHPYTVGLMRAVPDRRRPGATLQAIPGQPPDPGAMPPGCAFHPRCPLAQDICRTRVPELSMVGRGTGADTPGRTSACHFADDVIEHGVTSGAALTGTPGAGGASAGDDAVGAREGHGDA